MKEPWLAVFLSQIFPGIGQIYAERRARGFLILSLQVLFASIAVVTSARFLLQGGGFLVPVSFMAASIVLVIFNLFDAHGQATAFNREHNLNLPPRKKQPFLALFLSGVIPGLGQFYNGLVAKGIAFLVGTILIGLLAKRINANGIFFKSIAQAAIELWVMYDAYRAASTINGEGKSLIERWGKRAVYGVIALFLLFPASSIPTAYAVKTFYIQAYKMPAGSMIPTLLNGDHLFVNKSAYRKKKPQISDLIVFVFPTKDRNSPHFGKDFVKRVIAVEKQSVEIKNKKLFVDGNEQTETFVQHVDLQLYPASSSLSQADFQHKWEAGELTNISGNDARDNFGPITVPEGNVFVLGDNRDRSYDSRFWGPLPLQNLKGKVFLLYYPTSRWRRFN